MTSPPSSEQSRRIRHRRERIAAVAFVLLAAAAAGGIVWWKEAETAALKRNGLYIPGQVKVTPEMKLLQEYVRIDSSTPAGVAKAARWMHDRLTERGVRAEIIESAPGRLNVYARIRGRRPGEGLLLFNHLDVVAPGDGWSLPPFDGTIVADKMWGRGTLDMKSIAIGQMLVFAEIAHRPQPPEHDLVFLATADEETGSEFGMRWLLANRRDVVEGVRYGLTEGGVTEMMSEKLTYFGIETGGKQLVESTLKARDVETLRAVRIALEPHMFPRDAERVTPAVRDYFRAIAPTRMAFGPYLADIDRTIAEGEFWRLPLAYRDLTQNSLWASAPVADGEGAKMTVKQVNLPDENPDARLAWLSAKVRPYGVTVDVVSKEGPVPTSPTDTPLFQLLVREARQRYHVEAGPQILYRSASDSRFLRPLGIICYGVSPHAVNFYESLSIHGRNERIRLDRYMEGIAYLRAVINSWSGAA